MHLLPSNLNCWPIPYLWDNVLGRLSHIIWERSDIPFRPLHRQFLDRLPTRIHGRPQEDSEELLQSSKYDRRGRGWYRWFSGGCWVLLHGELGDGRIPGRAGRQWSAFLGMGKRRRWCQKSQSGRARRTWRLLRRGGLQGWGLVRRGDQGTWRGIVYPTLHFLYSVC